MEAVINIRLYPTYGESGISVLAAYAVADCLGLSEKEMLKADVSMMGVIKLEDEELNEFKNGIRLESTENSITVHWNDILCDVTGYHVRCYNADGKLVKGMHVYDREGYTFNNLRPDREYTVKLRGYKIEGGVKSYGEYVSLKIKTQIASGNYNSSFGKAAVLRRIKRKLKALKRRIRAKG